MKNKKKTSETGELPIRRSPRKSPRKKETSVQISASESEPNDHEATVQEIGNESINDGISANERNNLEEENGVELSQEVTIKSILNVEDLTGDDEVYTLQCPEQTDLSNKKLDFTQSKTFITSKNETLQAELLSSDKSFITLAVPKVASSGSLIKLPLKGHIVIHRVVDVPDSEMLVEDGCNKYKVVFPSDIKFRHPLLGIDWKAHVDLADAAFKRDSSFRKKSKKSKKEKIKDDDIVVVKKIKKEKVADVVEMKKLKRENSESDITPHKKKKRKTHSFIELS